MSATTEGDKQRMAIEAILAPLCDAEQELRAAVTRMAQQARTQDDAENLAGIIRARTAVKRAQAQASSMHANGRH